MSELIVSKYGGTSNSDTDAVLASMFSAEEATIIVTSAPGKLTEKQLNKFPIETDVDPNFLSTKITDQLLAARASFSEQGEVTSSITESITARYAAIVKGLGSSSITDKWINAIPSRVEDAARIGEDYVSMLGEQMQAEIYESFGWIMLDPSRFTGGSLSRGNRENWRLWLGDTINPGEHYILPGNTYFDGKRLKTFSRGGSDTAGALASYGLGAAVYKNNTDTSALSIDPRILRDKTRPRKIDRLTYREGRELGLNGVGLLHPDAMVPLMGTGIPTEIRNTFEPNGHSTLMTDEPRDGAGGRPVAISLIPHVAVINIHEPGMSGKVGRIANFADELAEREINLIDTIGYGADAQLFIVEKDREAKAKRAIKDQSIAITETSVEDRALITIVGHNIISRALDIRVDLALNTGLTNGYQRHRPHWFEAEHSLRFTVNPEDAIKITDETHERLIESYEQALLMTEPSA